MVEYIMRMLSISLYLFEGYCIQFFFGRFAEPQIVKLKNVPWAVGIVWIVIRIVNETLFRNTNSVTLIVKLFFSTTILLIFCMNWYKGNILLKIFLVIQFISIHELAFWAGYSFLYIGNCLIDILIHGVGDSMASVGYLPVMAGGLACFSVTLVEVIGGALLFVSVRKIAASYRCGEKGRWVRRSFFICFLLWQGY